MEFADEFFALLSEKFSAFFYNKFVPAYDITAQKKQCWP